jgi:malate dehydrogenase (oxaloacetate-decarboxylating)(NADP+)
MRFRFNRLSAQASSAFKKSEPLYYHSTPVPGKLTVKTTKPMNDTKDLSLAYSPGVAEPCLEIAAFPDNVYKYTNKGNMVAVVSNGTAVLGLGNIGAKASKPVMEGKAVLFNKFAGVESIDLCIDAYDMHDFVKCVKHLGPSFGGINLEDIKGPDCFYIEKYLQENMDIPVFHDD